MVRCPNDSTCRDTEVKDNGAAAIRRIVAYIPPTRGLILEAIVATMPRAGADETHIAGGVQARTAMDYGRKSIQALTEILGSATEPTNAEMVAGDTPGQAVRGFASVSALPTAAAQIVAPILPENECQTHGLKTIDMVRVAWDERCPTMRADTLEEAVQTADRLAFQHGEALTDNPHGVLKTLTNFGRTEKRRCDAKDRLVWSMSNMSPDTRAVSSTKNRKRPLWELRARVQEREELIHGFEN